MLIVGRAVAGAGAAAIFSGSMTIIGFTVPLRKRPMYIASVASMFGIASIVGPILGGAFTDRVSWVGVPVVLLLLLHPTHTRTEMVFLDQLTVWRDLDCCCGFSV